MGGVEMLTTSAVLLEVADAMSREPVARDMCAKLVRRLSSGSSGVIVFVERDLIERAVDLYEGRRDKTWSLTDCISFIVMADHRLSEALTGDHHFEQAGFVALLSPN